MVNTGYWLQGHDDWEGVDEWHVPELPANVHDK
jgi:hypothetical protein